MYTMKKKNPFLVLFLLVVLGTIACNFHDHTKTVKVSDGETTLKIEYCGDVVFNEDGTAVDEISPDGYIHYKCNGQKVYIESDENGTLQYKIYDNGERLHKSDAAATQILSDAVKKMEEHYYR